MRKKSPDQLLTSADLAHNRSGEATPQELMESMQRRVRVLEHSINAQMGVAEAFPKGSPEYSTALQIVEAMKESYVELKLEAAVARFRLIFDDNPVAAADVLENYSNQIEASLLAQQTQQPVMPNEVQMQTAPMNQESVPPMVEPHGTPIASELSDEELNPADRLPDDDSLVN